MSTVEETGSHPPSPALEDRLRVALRARELGDTLFEVERHLSTAPDPSDVEGLALGIACDALGACCGSIEHRELGGWATSHAWGSSLARVGAFHSDQESTTLAAMKRTGRTTIAQEDAADGRSLCGDVGEGAVRYRLSVPLTSSGGIVGALTFCFSEQASPTTEEAEFADRIGTLLSIWETNRTTMRRHRRVAEAFQRSLIDAPLTMKNLEIGHSYAPATDEEAAGGDFYDIFPIEDDRVAISIGDVAGRGMEAASMTAFVRDSIRVSALDALAPADVLMKTNRALLAFFPPEMFATTFFGVMDPYSGVMTYALGGGPLPIHVNGECAVTHLGHHGPLLGVLEDAEFEQQVLTLGQRDRLVLFTKGLSEVRQGDRTLDLTEIGEIVRTSERRDCTSLAQELCKGAFRFAGGALQDDVAILVIALKS